jgi:hypothetical protein
MPRQTAFSSAQRDDAVRQRAQLAGPDAMIPDKDEVGGFKPSQARQVMLAVALVIVR